VEEIKPLKAIMEEMVSEAETEMQRLKGFFAGDASASCGGGR
jgi:hypothetical protein